MTALNHAQQTSLLTHQYFRQPNMGHSFRENTIYVSPVVGTTASAVANSQQVQPLQTNNNVLSESASNSVQQQNQGANNLDQQQYQVNEGIDPRIPTATSVGSLDQNNPNCQGTQQPWLIPITTHQKQQQQEEAGDSNNVQQQQIQEMGHASKSVDQSISASVGLTSGKTINHNHLMALVEITRMTMTYHHHQNH